MHTAVVPTGGCRVLGCVLCSLHGRFRTLGIHHLFPPALFLSPVSQQHQERWLCPCSSIPSFSLRQVSCAATSPRLPSHLL